MNNVTWMLLGKQYIGPEAALYREVTEFIHITHELFWLLGLIYLGDYLVFDPFGCEKKMRAVEKKVDEFAPPHPHTLVLCLFNPNTGQ